MTRFPSFDDSLAFELEAIFTEKEILRALKETNSNKALGLDGFPFKFAQTFWDVLKSDLLGLIQGFFENA